MLPECECTPPHEFIEIYWEQLTVCPKLALEFALHTHPCVLDVLCMNYIVFIIRYYIIIRYQKIQLFVFSACYTLSLILCRYYVLAYLPDCIMGIDWRLVAALCLRAAILFTRRARIIQDYRRWIDENNSLIKQKFG